MQKENKYGTLHVLTTGEIGILRPLYLDTMEYNKVWVHCDSWFPFNAQQDGIGVTPRGEMYFMPGIYHSDFSHASIQNQQTFVHESVHVWQYQRGMNVMLRGVYSWDADYNYYLNGHFMNFTMEQQAQIVADYWVLTYHGVANWTLLSFCADKDSLADRYSYPALVNLYKEVLCVFPHYHF